jgi:hypothetical protein
MTSLTLIMLFVLICLSFLIFLKPRVFQESRILLNISALFLIIGIIGNVLWEEFKITTDIAYLGNVSLSNQEIQISQLVMFAISLGILIGTVSQSLLRNTISRDSKGNPIRFSLVKDLVVSKIPTVFVLSTGLVLLVIYLLGTGSTFWYNEEYLFTSGISIAYKFANSFIVAWCLTSSYLYFNSVNRITFFVPILNFIFFLAYFTEGSRQSLIIFIAWAYFFISKNSSRFRWFFVAPFIYLLIYLFQVTQSARSNALGLSQLFNLMSLATANDASANFIAIRRLFQSLFNWWVTIPLSVDIAQPSLILRNLNPLFGSGSNAFGYSSEGVERIYPYWWNPASTAGQLYGVLGFLGIVVIFGFLTFLLSHTIQGLKFADVKVQLSAFVAIILFLMQTLFFLQYSVRVWSRATQFFLIAYAIFWFLEKRALKQKF